ncbi:MAG: PRD domain-containing protein [Clostridia bacterium]|nr:PRD domain-containing protein [Clostridia bacterium]
MQNNYLILRVMNNNVLLTKDLANDTEAVLIGKGIGFGKKQDQTTLISGDSIEKSFYTYDKKLKNDYLDLLNSYSDVLMGVCAEIISMAEARLGQLSERIFIVLTDHISFAIERIKNGMEIDNPFVHEIEMLYPDEFAIGQQAKDMLFQATGISIPIGEIGFIALHLQAAKEHKDVKVAVKHTQLIKDIVELIETHLDYHIKVGSLTHTRLLTHIKGCIERVEMERYINNPLAATIKEEIKASYVIALSIKALMEKVLKKAIPEDEMVYLAIHIDRIRRIKDYE